tara:strand:+ start:117 stop:350 length:234 start_codon:yes stop_codon:yes gene_type:complete
MPDHSPTSLDARSSKEETFEDALKVLKEARLHLRETIGFCSAETSSLVLKTAESLIARSNLSSEERLRLVKELEALV